MCTQKLTRRLFDVGYEKSCCCPISLKMVKPWECKFKKKIVQKKWTMAGKTKQDVWRPHRPSHLPLLASTAIISCTCRRSNQMEVKCVKGGKFTPRTQPTKIFISIREDIFVQIFCNFLFSWLRFHFNDFVTSRLLPKKLEMGSERHSYSLNLSIIYY